MGVGALSARAVFLDRDGVINCASVRDDKPFPPRNIGELEILPGVAEALKQLNDAGFMLIVVTNQPDVARGTQNRATVEEINAALQSRLPIDDIRVCYHDDKDQCPCRKPKAGALLQSAEKFDIDLKASFMIGDRWQDIEAGRRAGCKTIFIDRHYAETKYVDPDHRACDLIGASDWILEEGRKKRMRIIEDLKIKIFADGADRASILDMYAKPYIKGFTTNPTLMRKAGIKDYREFALDILKAVPDRPVSFEVFSDEFYEMERQANEIAGWGGNVYVKIPITNTRRKPAYNLIKSLSRESIKLNITALMTLTQVREVMDNLYPGIPNYISVFAGRIADTGLDPIPLMSAALGLLRQNPLAELIWASPRELLNIFQADQIGCHVITVTPDILIKLPLVGKDLSEYSLDTVKMFYDDAQKAGYRI